MWQAAIDEVRDLHRFFQDWLRGSSPNDAQGFSRLAEALAPGFQIISPRGETINRSALLTSLRESHGSRGPDFRLWVDQIEGRPIVEGICLVTYQEWQSTAALQRGRVSSALFTHHAGHLLWQHVHETWLPADAF